MVPEIHGEHIRHWRDEDSCTEIGPDIRGALFEGIVVDLPNKHITVLAAGRDDSV